MCDDHHARFTVKTIAVFEGAVSKTKQEKKKDGLKNIYTALSNEIVGKTRKLKRDYNIEQIKKEMEILNNDNFQGVIGQSEVARMTQVPPPPGFEGKRE